MGTFLRKRNPKGWIQNEVQAVSWEAMKLAGLGGGDGTT